MGFADKLRNFFASSSLSENFFDDLSDLLVEGDFGAAPAVKLVDRLEQLSRKERINDPARLKERFAELLQDELAVAGNGNADELLALPEASRAEMPSRLQVILLLGVNGVGKTTTAAKLAFRYRNLGRKPILAAADTFRAGAVDQLKIHGERLKVRVVAHQQGGDPAAVVYDAAEAALAGGGDLIIADTAGRMHTKAALVEELKKISRVLETKLGTTAPTGRNALAQAEIFHDAVELDGVILTKYDSGAKGGIVFSLASELKLPAVFLCNGEGYEHIRPFDPVVFARAFAGLE